ncbi:hypothetical protein HPB52_012014 [Rhipicephalus sanguineus]|uniref:ABC transporter domain-containing protein n=1 Tax=Rhipicephalus sanguineus TaxID=34632 RepID=A0A9D4PN83_RHISA|nr:hypothetical protein HPB52_012014 [Rhipicephalus sanguineus]
MHDQYAVGEVTLEDCSFAWCKRDQKVDSPALDGMNLLVESGSLVGIVGTVGSGKTSLLSAIVGDMRHLSGSVSLNVSVCTRLVLRYYHCMSQRYSVELMGSQLKPAHELAT